MISWIKPISNSNWAKRVHSVKSERIGFWLISFLDDRNTRTRWIILLHYLQRKGKWFHLLYQNQSFPQIVKRESIAPSLHGLHRILSYSGQWWCNAKLYSIKAFYKRTNHMVQICDFPVVKFTPRIDFFCIYRSTWSIFPSVNSL